MKFSGGGDRLVLFGFVWYFVEIAICDWMIVILVLSQEKRGKRVGKRKRVKRKRKRKMKRLICLLQEVFQCRLCSDEGVHHILVFHVLFP